MKIIYTILMFACLAIGACSRHESPDSGPFPYTLSEESSNRPLSAAFHRSFHHWPDPVVSKNELYSQFKYTELKGFDYNGGDATITRRDPSKVLLENGKYYVWYTKRHTQARPLGMHRAKEATDLIPSADWDLAEIWYATSKDGFTWEEQGVAATRPPAPNPGFGISAPG